MVGEKTERGRPGVVAAEVRPAVGREKRAARGDGWRHWEEHSEQPLTVTSSTPCSWRSRLPTQPSSGKASRIAAARSPTSTYAFRSSDPRSSPSRAT